MGGQPPDLGLFPDISSLRDWITESKKAMSAQMGPTLEGVREEDKQVPMRDGSSITCRIYRPENPPSGGSPLAVIYHGGGWCIGGLENEELLCRLLTKNLGMISVNVDYRLAPEHKFPTPVFDCHDATKWVCLEYCVDMAYSHFSCRLRKMLLRLVQTQLKASLLVERSVDHSIEHPPRHALTRPPSKVRRG